MPSITVNENALQIERFRRMLQTSERWQGCVIGSVIGLLVTAIIAIVVIAYT